MQVKSARVSAVSVATLLLMIFSILVAPTANAAKVKYSNDADENCALQTDLKIHLDGDPTTYSLDPDTGELVPYSLVQSENCAQVTPPSSSLSSPEESVEAQYLLGTHEFTSGNRYFQRSDSNGTLYAQTSYGSGLPVAFRYDISSYLKSIATGSATVTAYRDPPNCHYSKLGISVYYNTHWSCGGHSPSTTYREYGNWRFPIRVNGSSGTATINWQFNYIIRLI